MTATVMAVSAEEWTALVRGDILMLAADFFPEPSPSVTWVFVSEQPAVVLPVQVVRRTYAAVAIQAAGTPRPWSQIAENAEEDE